MKKEIKKIDHMKDTFQAKWIEAMKDTDHESNHE